MDAMEYERDLQECVSIHLEEMNTSDTIKRIKAQYAFKESIHKWYAQHEKVCTMLLFKLKEIEEEDHSPEIIEKAKEQYRFEVEEREKRMAEWLS